MEPSYTFNGHFKAGVRFEEATLNMNNIGSSAATFDYYYFKNGGLRLFAGGGFGHYNISHSGGCGSAMYSTPVTTTKSSGGIARIGFEAAHFRFGLEYNHVPSTYLISMGADGHIQSTFQYRNSYFALKIGLCIGGGKKKPKYGTP